MWVEIIKDVKLQFNVIQSFSNLVLFDESFEFKEGRNTARKVTASFNFKIEKTKIFIAMFRASNMNNVEVQKEN